VVCRFRSSLFDVLSCCAARFVIAFTALRLCSSSLFLYFLSCLCYLCARLVCSSESQVHATASQPAIVAAANAERHAGQVHHLQQHQGAQSYHHQHQHQQYTASPQSVRNQQQYQPQQLPQQFSPQQFFQQQQPQQQQQSPYQHQQHQFSMQQQQQQQPQPHQVLAPPQLQMSRHHHVTQAQALQMPMSQPIFAMSPSSSPSKTAATHSPSALSAIPPAPLLAVVLSSLGDPATANQHESSPPSQAPAKRQRISSSPPPSASASPTQVSAAFSMSSSQESASPASSTTSSGSEHDSSSNSNSPPTTAARAPGNTGGTDSSGISANSVSGSGSGAADEVTVVPIRVPASGQEIHYRMRRTTPFLRIYDSFAQVMLIPFNLIGCNSIVKSP
jgi:hypothetical protein